MGNAVQISSEDRIVEWIDKITGRRLKRSACTALFQFIKFGLVGASNAAVNYLVYALALWVLRDAGYFVNFDVYVAQVVAFIISVLWSFYWNNRFVFKGKYQKVGDILKSLLKTYISYAFTGLLLSEVLLYLWVYIIGISEWIAPIINILLCLPINFILNKLWAFRN